MSNTLSAGRQIRVLIAEDDALVADVIENELEEQGYVVVDRVEDGLAAFERAQALRPDVLLMDITMPEMGGLEATKLVQQCCPMPVVLLTAHDDARFVADAGAAGAGAYLVKPSSGREIDRAITIAMARFGDSLELRRLNAELAAYDYSVSHDLRSPLALVCQSAIYLLEAYPDLPPEVLGFIRRIDLNGRRAIDIVENLLLLAQPGDVPVSALDMSAIAAAALQGTAELLSLAGAEVTVPPAWPDAMGNAVLVQRVWENYISNAVKYGGKPPRIVLGGERRPGGHVRFWVSDNGDGLLAASGQQLFNAFRRLQTGEVQGHGIGLFLVRRVVERLGGEVGVESTGMPGQGATFFFTLPAVGPA